MSILDIDFGGKKELVGYHYTCRYTDYIDCYADGEYIFSKAKNDVLTQRKSDELNFHKFLEHQLFTRLQELKYYNDVRIRETRRLIAVSPDCISSIQIIIRDAIYVIVHARSSDFDGALPADYEFLCTLPSRLIDNLEHFSGREGWESARAISKIKVLPVILDITFGSLHRTV